MKETLSPFEKKVSYLCSYEQDQSCSEMCIVCDNSRMRWHVQCWNHVKNVKSAADFKSILICISTKSEFNFHSTKVTLWVTIMHKYAWKSQVETMWKITTSALLKVLRINILTLKKENVRISTLGANKPE